MLSKVIHQIEEHDSFHSVLMEPEYYISLLQNEFPGCEAESMHTKGTLGIFFRLRPDAAGPSFIAKTHPVSPLCKERLRLESFIFQSMNPNAFVDFREINGVCFLIMKELIPLNHIPSPDAVRNLCAGLSSNKTIVSALKDQLPHTSDYLGIYRKSCEFLFKAGETNKEIHDKMKSDIEDLSSWIPEVLPVLCHGDLSDANILSDQNGKLILIDFEDAFIGYPDYDLLYWLTFYNHRCFYRPGLLSDIPLSIPLNIARATLLMITAVKCHLSAANGSAKTNSLSSLQRISEIMTL